MTRTLTLALFCLAVLTASSQSVVGTGAMESTEREVPSPTEGVINDEFIDEPTMMAGLLQMLADFSQYMVADYQPCTYPTDIGENCGCFRGESTMASNEAGVRTNADLSMLCAFLVKYAQPAGVRLPDGVSWQQLSDLAMRSLIFAYSTHKANRLKTCAGGDYWGSTSRDDSVWESSLWAMSVAYSAFFQWERLSEEQHTYIYNLLRAECNYELERSIPTGYQGDTKAEENGWEADVLAATLGLFPDDPLAPQWFERLRRFAINSYSHPSDANDNTIVDNDRTGTVRDLYEGPNLYEDFTLQNHNLFHTSYQNVVIQELGEAALALRLFQSELQHEERWHTNALMHHCQEVMDSVLCWLALADGELAMPNGNDWSLFLYDQITSYTTMAALLRDPNALMLENLAYKYIKARQQTTPDGSWLLRPDVQARRMGVQGHRVMMTWLMHHLYSTATLKPTRWEDFRAAHSEARVIPCQNVVRAFTKDRFTTFSWSKGLRSYTGYIASNSADKNKIIVPFRANNTGNFLGWYTVSGRRTDATPVVSGNYLLSGDAYTMNGLLRTNGGALNHHFALYSTPGNAVLHTDYVEALDTATITGEYGGLMAISVDEFTKPRRTLYHADGRLQSDGTTRLTLHSPWLNIDNEVGFVTTGGKAIAFGDKAPNNSILTAKVYTAHSSEKRHVAQGDIIDRRCMAYYSRISAEATANMAALAQPLTTQLPDGWNGMIAADPDGTHYLLLAHFAGSTGAATLSHLRCPHGAPVFTVPTTIDNGQATATFHIPEGDATGQPVRIFIKGSGIIAQQDNDNPQAASLTVKKATKAVVTITGERTTTSTLRLKAGTTIVSDNNGHIVAKKQ